MRKLSDTLARLSAMQARQSHQPKASDFQDRLSILPDFGSNPGALVGKFHRPEGLAAGAPLVVVLHGCLQTAGAYDHHSGWSRLADEAGFALLYPEQQRANNPNLCFNWFQPGDVRRGAGEVLSIRQMIEAMVTTHRLDRKRIFITGLSAGGAMAAAMLATYPEIFAGGSIIAGLAYGSASTIPEAFDRMRGHGGPDEAALQKILRGASSHPGPWPKISIWQGASDRIVDRSNAVALAGQWLGVHATTGSQSWNDGRNTRQVWSDADGEAVLEINMIAGMGHGTPIDPERLGAPGPYMLDVGLSSTLAIAQFWRIAEPEKANATRVLRSVPPAPRPAPARMEAEPARATQPAARLARPRPETEAEADMASGVRGIIENALRAAGLMR